MGREQSEIEERYNVITHGIGALLAIVGAVFLILQLGFPVSSTNGWIAILVYSFSQIFLYSCSTKYHYETISPKKKQWRKLDHIAIYISIAGTYTPICMLLLANSNGWTILSMVWGIALFGLVWKLFFTGKYESFSSILYLVMGWLIMLDIENVQALFSTDMMNLLILGGVFFTVGIVFYAWNKLYFNHVIWHLFVLAGSISHYFMVLELLDLLSS